MTGPQAKLVLWTGPRHSGKTTAAEALVRQARADGFVVAGLLAPSVYDEGQLVGFDALDLRTGNRVPLASRVEGRTTDVGNFSFLPEGMKLGAAALDLASARTADLVIVDEFGPLELRGGGWRAAVDSLIASTKAVIVLVVRDERIGEVQRLYGVPRGRLVPASRPDAAEAVLNVVRSNA